MAFEQQIQQWVSLDNQIKLYNDKITELREKRNQLNEKIMSHVEENGLERATVQITGGKLRFVKNKVANPLSFKYVEKELSNIIKNSEQVNQIVNHLKEKREFKVVSEIKRFSVV
jgi:uncharacterized coiled-coil DUF342 family protein